MKIEISNCGELLLKEVYNGITLETKEGNQICICMRDDTFEINVLTNTEKIKGIHNWHVVNMQNGTIEKMGD